MRILSVLVLFLASTGFAAASDYEEVRELRLDVRGIDTLSVDNGSGSIEIVGAAGTAEILVTATVLLEDTNDEKARKKIADDLVLTLDKVSGTAELKAYFEESGWFNFGGNASVSLKIQLPTNMHLVVDDGSGPIQIDDVRGDISLDDGSGSITLNNVGGRVEIDDGSGSIAASNVGGDISINDGSGSIRVQGVAGSVTIDDGSGGINVKDVAKDLVIVDDGSGGLDFSNIDGQVITES